MSADRKTLARPLPALVFVVFLVSIDQTVKLWAETNLPLRQPVEIIPMLALFRTYNEGIAFSFLAGSSVTMLIVVTMAIVAFVAYLWRSTDPDRTLAHLGYGLIVGGALGNLIDRAVYGHVVDYILFHTETWSFAVFNLADTFITLGAGAIVLDELLMIRRSRAASKGDED